MEVHFHELLPAPLNGIGCPAWCCSSLRQTMVTHYTWYRAFLNMVEKMTVDSNASGVFAILFSVYFKFVSNF